MPRSRGRKRGLDLVNCEGIANFAEQKRTWRNW